MRKIRDRKREALTKNVRQKIQTDALPEFEIRRARKREVAEQRRLLFPVRLVDYEAIKAWECFDADTAKDLATETGNTTFPIFPSGRTMTPLKRLLPDCSTTSQP